MARERKERICIKCKGVFLSAGTTPGWCQPCKEKTCVKCGKTYHVKMPSHFAASRFCTLTCHNSYYTSLPVKKCVKCGIVKDKSEFYPAKTQYGNPTVTTACISCHLLAARESNLKKRNSRPKVIIEDLPGETWVDCIRFEGKYKVSNLGRVKSLDRWVYRKVVDKEVFKEGKLLALTQGTKEIYPYVTLYGDTQKEKYPQPVYALVFFSFNRDVEKKPGYHIDHIDQDRTNSKLSNLQYISSRDNCIKRSLHNKKTSKFAGVSRANDRGKWQTGIRHNGIKYALGRYDSEEQAAQVYQNALDRISKGKLPV